MDISTKKLEQYRIFYRDSLQDQKLVETNVAIFLRHFISLFERSKKSKLSSIKIALFFAVGFIYAMIPGFIRVYNNDEFFIQDTFAG